MLTILNRTPLDITTKKEAIIGAYRLKLNNLMGLARTKDHVLSRTKIPRSHFLMPSKSLSMKHNSVKNVNFKVVDRENLTQKNGGSFGKGLV